MKQLVDDRLILNLVKKGSVDDYQKFLIIVYNFYQFQKRFIQPFRAQKMIQKKDSYQRLFRSIIFKFKGFTIMRLQLVHSQEEYPISYIYPISM